MSAEVLAGWMKFNDYEYITFGSQELNALGDEAFIAKINELAGSDKFTVVHQNRVVIIFQVV